MQESLVLSEEEAIELLTFLLASSRTQLDDPEHYGSMRLLSAAEHLRDCIMERSSAETRTLLKKTVEKTEQAHVLVNKTEEYTTALDELCALMASYLVDKSGLEGGSE